MNNNYFFERERQAMKRARRVERMQTIIFGTLFFLLVFVGGGIVGGMETHYSMKGTVLSSSADEVIVRDGSGEEWSFLGDGYRKGENVEITFYTNGTDNKRQDDEIVKVEKINN